MTDTNNRYIDTNPSTDWPGGPALLVTGRGQTMLVHPLDRNIRVPVGNRPLAAIEPESESDTLDRARAYLDAYLRDRGDHMHRAQKTAINIPQIYRETSAMLLVERAGIDHNIVDEAGDWDGKRGWTISGRTGSGKSRLAAMLALTGIRHGLTATWLPVAEMRAEIFGTFEGPGRLLQRHTRSGVLVVDDLGQSGGTAAVDELLLAILEHRGSRRKATIITTQYTGAALAGRFGSPEIGEAIVRRCGPEYQRIITLTKPDAR
jgi:hypothetical protein